MANRDTSIDPRLLDSARKHFKEKGFLNAQLSDICRDAGVTTGAVYIRYKGKKTGGFSRKDDGERNERWVLNV